MTNQSFGRRLLKISGYIAGFLVVASVAFHFWFKAHARQLIEDLVESRSNGKIRLQVDKFRFNWFSKKMEFEDAVFISTDTSTASTAYRFSVDRIRLKLDAVLPIVFNKRIIIDTLTLTEPEIRVTRLRKTTQRQHDNDNEVSLPEEMGKIYNSIQDALQVLRVSRFMIDRGTFVLENQIRPEQRPVVIGNLFFQIDNLAVDTTIEGARDKILFSDNVILRSHDQDIVFPDERHRLNFARFNINLQQKLVEFDSCTISALRTDSSSAAFTMYMDALKLIDIDFDTLYKSEVIKADSVYCMNPRFNISVELGKNKGAAPPSLENIIKSLTGDLVLNNVVVSNADFNIHSIRDGVPTSYSFTGNSFDMQGLRIDQDAAAPIKVESFTMAIQNYENFIKDSSYRVQFDSVLFRDDRIFLSNFVFHKLDNGRIINTFNIPQFYLGGLSWDDLVFERKLKADQATLFYPRIDYRVSDKLRSPGGRSGVFESLASINEIMDLAYLDVIDGDINLVVSPELQIKLQEATLSIKSRNLLQSTQLAGIKNSLTALDFRDGIIRAGDVVMKLRDLRYIGESGRLTAASVLVNDRKGNLALDLKEVFISQMLVDEKRGDIVSDNITWESGDLRFSAGGAGRELGSILSITNVNAKNTKLNAQFGKVGISTFFHELKFDRLDKRPGSRLELEGLHARGADLDIRMDESKVSAKSYQVTDQQSSRLTDVQYTSPALSFHSPGLGFVPFVESYISGENRVGDVVVEAPVIRMENRAQGKGFTFPNLLVNRLRLNHPRVDYKKIGQADTASISWEGQNTDAAVVISGLESSSAEKIMRLATMGLDLSGFDYVSAAGKRISTGNGNIKASLENIEFSGTGNTADWKATVKEMSVRDLLFDSSGKKKNRFHIESGVIRDLAINTASITNLSTLTSANRSFRLSDFTGSLTNVNTVLKWTGASLSRTNASFRVDSISWRPHLEADSFLARQKLQTDYVALSSGAISLANADIERFIRDKTVSGSLMEVDDLELMVVKDSNLPRDSGKLKPLPVEIVQRLNFPVQIGRLRAQDATVEYTEISPRKNRVTIPITGVNLEMENLKNYDLNATDSLYALLSGTLLDSVKVSLELTESYDDTLGGFRLLARFGGARMSVLNPATVPLGSIYIRSGEMDTAWLRVVANDHLAFGEMNMRYRNLKVQLLKEGSELNGKNTRGFLSFLANTFVIRNNSRERPAVIYVTRLRDRSIFNYLVKIATRGFQTSIGVGRNRKLTRQYEAKLKELGLPPFRTD